jgi:hypothetical protein
MSESSLAAPASLTQHRAFALFWCARTATTVWMRLFPELARIDSVRQNVD